MMDRLMTNRTSFLFAVMTALIIFVGFVQSWNVAFTIINLCLISAIMTLGVNIQWGYAGLVNFGLMGFGCPWRICRGVDIYASCTRGLGSRRDGDSHRAFGGAWVYYRSGDEWRIKQRI